MASRHWGEIPPIRNAGIANAKKEQITKVRAVDVIGAKLYCKPCPSSPLLGQVSDAISCERTLHSIKLLKYQKKLKTLLWTLEQLQKKAPTPGKYGETVILPAPSIPEIPESLQISITKGNTLKDFESSAFVQGIGEPPPPINIDVARKILWKAVGIICAHAGYDVATNVMLDTLTDIVEDFFIRFCEILKCHAVKKRFPEPTIFPDAVESTCQEIGLGTMFTLGEFYEIRVIQYHKRLMDNSAELRDNYEKLRMAEVMLGMEEERTEGTENFDTDTDEEMIEVQDDVSQSANRSHMD